MHTVVLFLLIAFHLHLCKFSCFPLSFHVFAVTNCPFLCCTFVSKLEKFYSLLNNFFLFNLYVVGVS